MISVLIPVYNYNIVALVNELHKQLIAQNIAFEIICLEDGSDPFYIEKNSEIEKLASSSLMVSETNNGRIKTRQLLCDKAQYDWLLFLDADVMPKRDCFISTYINSIHLNNDAIYGGFAYHKEPPNSDYMLRWNYGKSQEEVDAVLRNKTPYKIIISANFLIKKQIFDSINSGINHNGYGFDNYFGALLKGNNAKVFHINNEVYHLGIEKSTVYLNKKEQAAETLLKLVKEKRIKTHDNSLLSLFLSLKRFKLHYLFSFIYRYFNSKMKNNLLGNTPSVTILQLYRISYMCYKDLNS
jgi:hypothetical protein